MAKTRVPKQDARVKHGILIIPIGGIRSIYLRTRLTCQVTIVEILVRHMKEYRGVIQLILTSDLNYVTSQNADNDYFKYSLPLL